LSQWDKLIEEILKLDRNLRFADLAKALTKMGYIQHQPKGGGSHYTFRTNGKAPITIPKAMPMNRVYIKMVRDIVVEYKNDEYKNEAD
jgi:predicted RNA binding protein YcfA (HicA-like mRNA interferase family)